MTNDKEMTGFEMVREFHKTFDAPVHTVPTIPAPDRIRLRLNLILEEVAEVVDVVAQKSEEGSKIREAWQLIKDASEIISEAPEEDFGVFSITDMAKELTDVNVVVYGTGHEIGADLDLCMKEVHRSNMSKAGPDGKPIYREDGKIMKGPNYSPADLRPIVYPLDKSVFKVSEN